MSWRTDAKSACRSWTFQACRKRIFLVHGSCGESMISLPKEAQNDWLGLHCVVLSLWLTEVYYRYLLIRPLSLKFTEHNPCCMRETLPKLTWITLCGMTHQNIKRLIFLKSIKVTAQLPHNEVGHMELDKRLLFCWGPRLHFSALIHHHARGLCFFASSSTCVYTREITGNEMLINLLFLSWTGLTLARKITTIITSDDPLCYVLTFENGFVLVLSVPHSIGPLIAKLVVSHAL